MPRERFLCLCPDQPQVLNATPRTELQVTTGLIWLTVAGSRHDVFLCAGQNYVLPRSGRAVVEAVHGDACMMFRAAAPVPFVSRLSRGIGSLLKALPRFVTCR